jgi:hypothetical protein
LGALMIAGARNAWISVPIEVKFRKPTNGAVVLPNPEESIIYSGLDFGWKLHPRPKRTLQVEASPTMFEATGASRKISRFIHVIHAAISCGINLVLGDKVRHERDLFPFSEVESGLFLSYPDIT